MENSLSNVSANKKVKGYLEKMRKNCDPNDSEKLQEESRELNIELAKIVKERESPKNLKAGIRETVGKGIKISRMGIKALAVVVVGIVVSVGVGTSLILGALSGLLLPICLVTAVIGFIIGIPTEEYY